VHLFAADGARGRDFGHGPYGLGESPGVGGVADLASLIAS
jgi:hypothetical protein